MTITINTLGVGTLLFAETKKMNRFLFVVITISLIQIASSTIYEIQDAQDLLAALENVNPGDTVILTENIYYGNFETFRSGTRDQRITIRGSRNAVIDGNNSTEAFGFWLKADYWVVEGFTVQNSLRGIIVEGGNFNLLQNLEVRNIIQECVHFRWNSADNIIRNCYVHHCGQGDGPNDHGFGEGIYLGQAFHNWLDGEQDKSDRNQVLDNVVGPNVNAEAVDIKEGSCCGIVRGNLFFGPELGEHFAVAWMDVKGEGYLIEENIGYEPFLDGFQIHYIPESGMGGRNNTIVNNHCNGLPPGGQCVYDTTDFMNIIENNQVDSRHVYIQ